MAIQIDLGKLRIVNKGTWSSATTYEADDVVQYEDSAVTSTFIATATSTNQAPSTGGTVNSSYWALMAKGTDAVGQAWNPSQTADFTAAAENGYFVDTSSGAITVTLPANPSTGSIVSIVDYAKTFHTNHCTIARNGNSIEGVAEDWVLYGKGTITSLRFEAPSGGQGWKFTEFNADGSASTHADSGTGGSRGNIQTHGMGSKKYMVTSSDAEEVYMDGDFQVHKFLTSGTFTVHSLGTDSTYGDKIEYLIVGGGGSGGQHHGSGGGAGGYRANNAFDHTVTAQAYTITVGAGASRRDDNSHGNNGSNSNAFGMTSDGGGGGGGHPGGGGRNGGSGGGGNHQGGHGNATGNGSGHRGGPNGHHQGGGGGGASEPGADHYGNHQGGHGGRGTQCDIDGTPKFYAGGGGSPGHNHTNAASGGLGGGGDGSGGQGEDGTGGGGGGSDAPNGGHRRAGDGGDGIVIVRLKVKD